MNKYNRVLNIQKRVKTAIIPQDFVQDDFLEIFFILLLLSSNNINFRLRLKL